LINIVLETNKETKKILSSSVEINKEKEYEVKKILNRRYMREKLKYLVKQKRYTAEENT